MSAVSDSEDERTHGSRVSRWAVDHDIAPSPSEWLLGTSGESAEITTLRERLADAERRAADAEEALPHLLALGQRTVNGLLSDARARGRQIIEEARDKAQVELETERRALAAEAAELDALRLAVACEAMGLEQIRNELEASVAAMQLGTGGFAGAVRPSLPPAAASAASTFDPAASLLPPPPSPTDLDSVGMASSASPSTDPGSSRFAAAWAAGEDEMMTEAFDRFFAAEIASDPQRDAVIDEDESGSATTA
jgi:hypothetical protein